MSGNVTNSSSKSNCHFYDEPQISYVVRVVSCALIMFFSITGNFLVCRGAISRRNRPYSYYLVINLAVAELLITSVLPFRFHYTIKPWNWIWGNFMCHFVNFVVYCGFTVVTFTLAAIAVYRCIVMLHPYKRRNSKYFTFGVISLSWIFGFASAFPTALFRKVEYQSDICNGILRCNEYIPGGARSRYLYSNVRFSFGVAVPLIVMVMAYGIVVFKVKRHIRRTKREESTDASEGRSRTSTLGSFQAKQLQIKETPIDTPPKAESPKRELHGPMLSNNGKRETKKMIQLENDVLNMIYIIIITFFLFYTPGQVMFIMYEQDILNMKKWEKFFLFYYHALLLHLVPSVLHPIFYGTMSKIIAIKHLRRKK